MNQIKYGHDRFFKSVFSGKEEARDFLLNHLPESVVGLLDLDSLEPGKDTFVDQELRESLSDLIYQVYTKTDSQAYVYVLFEHKSHPEPLIALHLLRYMVRIWEHRVKQGVGRYLPPIIPLVVYHGLETWTADDRFSHLFDPNSELGPFLPEFRFLLFDLSRFGDEEIKGAAKSRVALLLLKYIFRDELAARLPGIFQLLKELEEVSSGLEYLITILNYLASNSDKIAKNTLTGLVKEAFTKKGGDLMGTIAEEWLQEGEQRGRLSYAREDLIDILDERFGLVPESVKDRITSMIDLTVLKRLLRKAAIMNSIDEFQNLLINGELEKAG
ncbi:MAG: Rpn family recombination-promoting nuclease/putative transposase [Deltaproteobacteria bacterium]|nr:Rpn family recombination-promoting nuclease/putative transposase [Deltaproteobacteria bacterium]